MISPALAFVVACVVAGVLTPLVRRVALRASLVEGADGVLKVHDRAVPRVGGVAIVAGFLAPVVGIFALGAGITALFEQDPLRLVAFLSGALAIFGLGLWDDVFGLSAVPKLSVQVIVAVGTWFAGFRIDAIRLPGLGSVELGAFGLALTILWIVGLTNALNLVDGMDGLAAGVALFAAGANAIVGVVNDNIPVLFFSAALAGAVLGFLPHNFPPARLFMGDSGSLFLGYSLAVTSMYGATVRASTAVALLGPILILGLPILDTTLAVIRRTRRGQPVFDGDREHLHHRMLALGLSQRRSVLLLYALCAAFGLAGLMATAVASWPTAAALVALLGMLVVFERRLLLFRNPAPDPQVAHPVVTGTRELLGRLQGVTGPESAWAALCGHAEAVGALRLQVVEADGSVVREWRSDTADRVLREGLVTIDVPLAARLAGGPARRLLLVKRRIRRGVGVADDLLAVALEAAVGAEPPASPAASPAPPRRAAGAD